MPSYELRKWPVFHSGRGGIVFLNQRINFIWEFFQKRVHVKGVSPRSHLLYLYLQSRLFNSCRDRQYDIYSPNKVKTRFHRGPFPMKKREYNSPVCRRRYFITASPLAMFKLNLNCGCEWMVRDTFNCRISFTGKSIALSCTSHKMVGLLLSNEVSVCRDGDHTRGEDAKNSL